MAETTFEKLTVPVSCLCASNGEKFTGACLVTVGFFSANLVLNRLRKLQLNFPSDDVIFALKDSKELPWLAKYL